MKKVVLSFICFFLIPLDPNSDTFVMLFVMLLRNISSICLFLNLCCISLLEFLLFSILSFVLVALSAVFIGVDYLEDFSMGFLIYGTPFFLSKLIYTLVNRPVSPKNLEQPNIEVQENLTANFWKRFSGFLLLYFSLFSFLGAGLNAFLSVCDFSQYGLLYNIYRPVGIFIGVPVFSIFLPLFLMLHMRGKATSHRSPSKIHPLHLCVLFLSGLSYFIFLGIAIILNDVDLHDKLGDLWLLFVFVFAVFIISLSAKTALKKRIFMKKNS